jgi:two-component system sensor histidine kinase ChiS
MRKTLQRRMGRKGLMPMEWCCLVALMSATQAIAADSLPQACRAIAIYPIPDAALCARRFGANAGLDRGVSLRQRADADIRSGDFNSARVALGCARAHVGPSDWREQYETLRRYGVLEYRRENVDLALVGFECALHIAERHEDVPAIAKQSKNIGAAMLRLGDYRGAQTALERSVSIQRVGDDSQIGSALNNLGDLYREKKDPTKAMRYYREALTAYRRYGDEVEAAHSMERMSVIELDRGDTTAAIALLRSALDTYQSAGQRPDRLRVYAGLTRAALLEGDARSAMRWSADGMAFAAEHQLPIPAPLNLQKARADRAEGRSDEAAVRLRAALASLSASDPERIGLLDEFSLALADAGQYPQAVAVLREAKQLEHKDALARFNRQTGWQRSRFEAGERERRIAYLEHENLQRRMWLWLVSVSSLALLLGASLIAMRRRQRERIAEAERRARNEEVMERYRREAEALQIDRRLLLGLLATSDEALCLLDAEGQVLAANAKACALLSVDENELIGTGLAMRWQASDRSEWAGMLDRIDESGSARWCLSTNEGVAIAADIAQWEFDGDLLSLSLRATAGDNRSTRMLADDLSHADIQTHHAPTHADMPAASDSDAQSLEHEPIEPQSPAHQAAAHQPSSTAGSVSLSSEHGHSATQDEYRRELVALMLAAVEAWERATVTSRIELAERSRIWRVSTDDGRLRARVMERYLALSKLPQNPRWRDVLRTAYFVLANAGLDVDLREPLQQRIDSILAHRRRTALT